MAGKEKEGGLAISVPWRYWKAGLYSGFHLDPELASRDEGAPREGRTRGAVGGIVPIATISRHKPFSEFKNIDA
jgi:hypothetical protein